MYQMTGKCGTLSVAVCFLLCPSHLHPLLNLLCLVSLTLTIFTVNSYYTTTSSEISLRLKPVAKLIQHSIPAVELRPPFIPTHLSVLRLQNFHRAPLKRFSHGQQSLSILHPVFSLSREISWKAQVKME